MTHSCAAHRRRSRLTLALVTSCLLLLATAPARLLASDLNNVLTDYTIASWSERDGLPPGTVWALAQDAEGYLWLGMDVGLIRFDGARFVVSTAVPKRPIRALFVARDQSLWVGFGGEGGAMRIARTATPRTGTAEYDGDDGLPPAAINALAEDRDGHMWAATDDGLFEFDQGRWTAKDSEAGVPAGPAYSVHANLKGEIYVSTAKGVFRRSSGQPWFDAVELLEEEPRLSGATTVRYPRAFAESRAGTLTVTDVDTGFRTLGAHRDHVNAEVQRGRGYRLLYDRQENLWVGTLGQGLWRVRSRPGSNELLTEKVTYLTGMVSDGVRSLIEDRGGNIWVGSSEGLNRVTARRIILLTEYGPVLGIDAGPDGTVWVATVNDLLWSTPTALEEPAGHVSLRGARLSGLHVDERGQVWVATDRGVSLRSGHELSVVLPGTASLVRVKLLTSDGNGGVWMADQERGVVHWRDGHVKALALEPSLKSETVSALYTDQRHHVWMAIGERHILEVRPDGHVEQFGPEIVPDLGQLRQIYQDQRGTLWVVGSEGLGRLTDRRMTVLNKENGFPVDNLGSIVDDEAQNLWIGTGSGVLRVPARELDAALADRSHKLPYVVYTRKDGIGGNPFFFDANRRVLRDVKGRVWFITSRGLTLIDPSAVGDLHGPPVVRIDEVVVDDRPATVAARLALPARTSRLEIAYGELNLTSPLRTKFRYRLEGFDTGWVEAATRRQAFYTNLPPRDYRFVVQGSTFEGEWTEPGAAWDFSIRPAYYQTTWFAAACVGLSGLAVWFAWQMRMRHVRHEFSLVLAERIRLSRDLHDTLLQSLVGMALQFDHLAAELESSSPPIRRQFVRLRKQVERYVRETRQAIWNLRSPKTVHRDFVSELREVATHSVAGHSIDVDVTVSGTPYSCPRNVEEHLLRISQEGVNNAVRHARASRIAVAVQYQDRELRLTVEDDGRGFDPSSQPHDGTEHYGLTSMRERAEEAGASFDIVSAAGRGTQITAVVPIEHHV